MKKVESFTNKSIKWVKKLISDSKQRRLENLAVVETKKIFLTILEIVKNEDIEAIFVTNDFLLNPENKKILHKFNDKICVLKNVIFNAISTLKTPDGIICVFRPGKTNINITSDKNYIALYNLQNPNNLGAIIRSCLAFGIKDLFLIGNCVDLYHPDVIRSSMGYAFQMNVEKFNSFDYFLAKAKQNNLTLLATANNKNAINIFDYKQVKNNCFIIGNEGQGLPDEVLNKCNHTIKIPLSNNVESLNASVATSVVAFWLNHENH